MKIACLILLFLILAVSPVFVIGQQSHNISEQLEGTQADSNKLKLLLQLARSYYFSKPDSCLIFAQEAEELARRLHSVNGELIALNMSGEALRFLGEFPQALDKQFKALQINKNNKDKVGEAGTLGFIGFIYIELNEYRQALSHLLHAKAIFASVSDPIMSAFNLSNIGNTYEKMNMLDSALFFQQQARVESLHLPQSNLKILTLTRLGIVFARLGKLQEALQNYREAIQSATLIGDKVNPSKIQFEIAKVYFEMGQIDSTKHYAKLSLMNARTALQKLQLMESSNLLVKLFRNQSLPDSVIHYQDIAIAMQDSLYGPRKLKHLQLLILAEQQRQQELQRQQERIKNRISIFSLLGMIGFILVFLMILYRNNRQKHKANIILEQTLSNLKATQSQLIQSEKMASLGELTAGIAHEIQNPLNFVNNFSEVNAELIEELKIELLAGNTESAITIISDIGDNEQKINHHGKRADAIVKGMLQHSRSSDGTKEPTDISALADEYLRLAYHGLRAKDKRFNAAMITEFDDTIGKINIIPQDIGRVILNLITNAFYAVIEKQREFDGDYQPTVVVSTKNARGKVEIIVSDNGKGIPQNILDKIFQPFFTTKPTGKGTGLGLSLSYDAIKAHGGEIKVETREGEGTDFTIILPK